MITMKLPPKLKIFLDPEYLLPGQTPEILARAFWEGKFEDAQSPEAGRFDAYSKTGKSLFELTGLADADIAILPGPWVTGSKAAKKLAREASRFGKKIIMFFNSDSDEAVPVKNAVIFRTTLYRAARKPNEYALPAWSEDFLERYCGGKVQIRKKTDRPTVSYCGQIKYKPAKIGLKKFLMSPLAALRFWSIPAVYRSAETRKAAINRLQSSRLLETNFQPREKFWGGAIINGKLDPDLAVKARREYVNNLLNGDYTLCVRGAGNFSYRIYEALSLGRIPVLVDTDCVLPYEQFIDWKKFCVIVDAKDLARLDEKILEFHDRLSEADFENLQRACRNIWEEWLSPLGFFKNFHRYFHGPPIPQKQNAKSKAFHWLLANRVGYKLVKLVETLKKRRFKFYPISGRPFRGLVCGQADFALHAYEPEVAKAIDKIVKPGWLCADIGSNVGIFSLLMAKKAGLFGRVVAVDAFFENLEAVERNASLNGFSGRIEVCHFAATDGKTTTAKLYAGKNNASEEWNIIGTDVAGVSTREAVDVPAMSLDRFFPQFARLDFVKMDIEGAEAMALAGMRRILNQSRPLMIIEFHNGQTWSKRSLLYEAEYRLYTLDGQAIADDAPRVYQILAAPKEYGLSI